MANFEVPQDPQFTDELRMFQTSDPGHADLFNEVNRKLFCNALFLKKVSESVQDSIGKINSRISNVDNTADLNKPVSKAQQAALDSHTGNNAVHITDGERKKWNETLGTAKDYTDNAYQQSTGYTDQKISNLIGGAPTTLDTLKEIADAMAANESVVDALDTAIGTKASQVELDGHKGNNTIHVTQTDKNNWNGKVTASGGDLSNTKVNTFDTVTAEFPVPAAGESTKTVMGKIRKFIQDFNSIKAGIITLGKLANNCTTTASGYALDARQGKALKDGLETVNSSLGGNKLISEGSGANAKYYIQLGADTASKKLLGSRTVRLLGTATSLRSACSFTVPRDAKLIVVVSSSNDRTMPENNISGIQSTTLSDISRGSWTGSEDACNFQHQKVYSLNAKSGDVITANASGTRFYICMSILSIE